MTEATATQTTSTPVQPIPIVQTWELGKVYRSGFWLNQKVESLQSVTLTVHQGETFGLLGPNGAGKTTLLKILLGIVRRSRGRATLLGKPLGDQSVKHNIGYLPENPYFYDYLTAWEFLGFTASLFGISKGEQQKRIPQLLDWVELAQETATQQPLRKYSKGMLQRVGIAQALINNPAVVFLDEPMSGLDPTGRYRIREIIQTLKREGKTIFFNSHILADVEEICDRIAILAKGQLLCQGTIAELVGTADHYQATGIGGSPEMLQRWLHPLEFSPQGWHGQLTAKPQDFLDALQSMDAKLTSLTQARLSLEDFFLQQLRTTEQPSDSDDHQ
ncbi:ABC transporter ATP-binding protein [Spirulina sp. CS-785/01]|uniref:ABC transporter ATP-binding protein n=1 Tax=Spirulina sp. CS-785/01 TaxID=3021716 RepID=UPI003FA70576